jgi:hypothetical protein
MSTGRKAETTLPFLLLRSLKNKHSETSRPSNEFS